MTAIQNQQTDLVYLLSIDNQEITEHNRRTSISTNQSSAAVELGRGVSKRYIKKNKKNFSIFFSYLPSAQEKTVDGRKGRDYLVNLANKKNTVLVKIKLNPSEEYKEYECYLNSYSEKLIRRDIPSQCSYYDVNLDLEEI
jgi:hypothetical protein